MSSWPRFEYSQELDWIQKSSCIICTIYCILIFCITIRLFIFANLIDLSNVGIKKIAVLSLIVLLSYIVSCASFIVNHWAILISKYIPCRILIHIEGYLYTFSKFLLYIFLTFRVDIAFDSSSLQYSKYTLHLFRLYLLIALLSMWFAIFLYVGGFQIKSQVGFRSPYCQSIIPLKFAAFGIFFDATIACSCLALFGRKIYQASMQSQHKSTNPLPPPAPNPQQKAQDKMLMYTYRKSAVLAFVAILSTSVALVVSTMGLTAVALPLDNCINASCVMIMFAASQPIYDGICGKCDACITDSLLAKLACIWSEQHLDRVSTIRVTSVSSHHHNQTSRSIALSSLQTSQKSISSPSILKPAEINVIGLHKKYLTPSHTLSITPASTQSTATPTPTPIPFTCGTPTMHKKQMRSIQITPVQYGEEHDDKTETFTHVTRQITDFFQSGDVHKIVDILANEARDSENTKAVALPVAFEEMKDDFVEITLDGNDDKHDEIKKSTAKPQLRRNLSDPVSKQHLDTISKEFILMFCKDNKKLSRSRSNTC